MTKPNYNKNCVGIHHVHFKWFVNYIVNTCPLQLLGYIPPLIRDSFLQKNCGGEEINKNKGTSKDGVGVHFLGLVVWAVQQTGPSREK